MLPNKFLVLGLFSIGVSNIFYSDAYAKEAQNSAEKPNIVLFYVDDLGWGDLSSYGATEVNTPNIDALAKNGIRFTDAHSSAATCSPSRYSLLTGEHAFRKNIRILKGDAPLVISEVQKTLPKMLQTVGYRTGIVGKWHLGLGDGNTPVNWNEKVKPGPLEVGFDYSFLIPATGDRVPSVFLENHDVVNLEKSDPLFVNYQKKIGQRPTGYEKPELLKQGADEQHNKSIINGVSRIGWMQGGESAEWHDETFNIVTSDKAKQFISESSKQPFFLLFSFHDIHVPRLPNEMFRGKTNMGARGDSIVQMDWTTGQVVEKLRELNLLDNTLVIFTSDNGAVLTDGYDDEALKRIGTHKQNGPYRGGKYSIYEAGTRIPFIVHYPNRVKPGVSNSLFSQIDLYASIAELLGVPLEETEAIDSQNQLSPLFDASKLARKTLVQETPHAKGLRENSWKYIRPTEKDVAWVKAKKNIDPGTSKAPQLFDLDTDPSELHNLAAKYPDKVKLLEQKLQDIELQSIRLKSLK